LKRKRFIWSAVTNVVGCGRQRGISEVYPSHKEAGRLLRTVVVLKMWGIKYTTE
jgi:nitrogen regulatory protein PII